MGFFMIQQARPNQIVTVEVSEFAALVTVEQGSVSAELLQSELARILPVQWTWSAQGHGDKAYIVPFPCKEELDRMVAIRRLTTKNQEGTLLFEEFEADVQPIRVLDQVWVTVTNVPRILKSYLSLWAVGSCIGATQKVDMVHLRKTGEVRILVAAFDTRAIAKQVDVCVNRSIYRLYFTADAEVTDVPFNPDDDDLLDDDSNRDMDGNGDHHMDDAMEDNNKTQQSSDTNNHPLGQQFQAAVPPPTIHHTSMDTHPATEKVTDLTIQVENHIFSPSFSVQVTGEQAVEVLVAAEGKIGAVADSSTSPAVVVDSPLPDVPMQAEMEDITVTLKDSVANVANLATSPLPAAIISAEVAAVADPQKDIVVDKDGAALVPAGVTSPLPAAIISAEVAVVADPQKDVVEEVGEAVVPAAVSNHPTQGLDGGSTARSFGSDGVTTAGKFSVRTEDIGALQQPVVHNSVQHELHAAVPPMHGAVQVQHEMHAAVPSMHGPVQVHQVEEGLAPPWVPKTTSDQEPNQRSKVSCTAVKPTVRRSARNKATADDHTLEKTARMATKKNLESTGASSASFSVNRMASNLFNLGINSSDIAIKNLEIDRVTLQASKKLVSKSNLNLAESDEEKESRLDAVLSHVCGNINEDMQDTEMDHIIDLSPVRRKKKSTAAKNLNRGRPPKKPKTPSKIKLK